MKITQAYFGITTKLEVLKVEVVQKRTLSEVSGEKEKRSEFTRLLRELRVRFELEVSTPLFTNSTS